MEKIYQVGKFQTLNSFRAITRASETANSSKTATVVFMNGKPFATVQKNGKLIKH